MKKNKRSGSGGGGFFVHLVYYLRSSDLVKFHRQSKGRFSPEKNAKASHLLTEPRPNPTKYALPPLLRLDHGSSTVADPERGDLVLHGHVPSHLVHRPRPCFCRLLRDLRSVWVAWCLPEAEGLPAADAAPHSSGSARRGHRGGAEAVRWVRSQQTPSHGNQGPNLWCVPEQVWWIHAQISYTSPLILLLRPESSHSHHIWCWYFTWLVN